MRCWRAKLRDLRDLCASQQQVKVAAVPLARKSCKILATPPPPLSARVFARLFSSAFGWPPLICWLVADESVPAALQQQQQLSHRSRKLQLCSSSLLEPAPADPQLAADWLCSLSNLTSAGCSTTIPASLLFRSCCCCWREQICLQQSDIRAHPR